MSQGLDDLRAIGAISGIDQVLSAYQAGLFPMGIGQHGAPPIGWWAPLTRGVLRPGDLRVTRSLRRSLTRFTWSVDAAFAEVVAGCADPDRDGAWITPQIAQLYQRLHEAGHAHSIEVYEDGRLAGGLYGVAFGGVFCGESMFHTSRDASKVALVRLVELLDSVGDHTPWIIDAQWQTSHLETLGVSEVSGFEYLEALAVARGGRHFQAFLTK
ncbi:MULTISPECIES: leucyl/phenylalanyl-tRNA--protein transferase [Brevibacterium]|uniref:leucyl/phenylalanyl-tRNA--protein transferase n=1 Tax=Brevibacterium TaxID=1696 RepID=UPI0021AAFFF0|nr:MULTISPECIES: leucyl/phenylalanyl-tRNA--protein transferase [Brevibacterium]MCT1691746.1 leucyl/phenylalanyl-tRNA--protein transferase [Brevibacterium sp. p3-SID960]MCT1830500.1 leucyl/phenylalanyl-tRNA--protein transferase [Brevibacterium luteolum]